MVPWESAAAAEAQEEAQGSRLRGGGRRRDPAAAEDLLAAGEQQQAAAEDQLPAADEQQAADAAELAEAADAFGDFRRSFPRMPSFLEGHGFPLMSYMPSKAGSRKTMEHMVDYVSRSLQPSPEQPDEAPALADGEPRHFWFCGQKLVDYHRFDPQAAFFKSGVHMPLLVFLGRHSNRSAEKATSRNKAAHRRRAKAKAKAKGKGKGGEGVSAEATEPQP